MNRSSLPALALGVLTRPRTTFDALTATPRPSLAVAVGSALGVIWAGFAAWLAADGHRPSMTHGLPVAPERYYATAAVYLAPLWVGLTGLTAMVAHVTARALGGVGSATATASTVGPAYALPLLALYLVPDIIAYAIAGHGALGWVLKVGLPLAVVGVVVRTVQAVRITHELSLGRALVAACVAGVVQAVPFALLVR